MQPSDRCGQQFTLTNTGNGTRNRNRFSLPKYHVCSQKSELLGIFFFRLDVIYISYSSQAIFEIRMSAGEHEEIYENSKREMFIVKEKKLCGPLFPCEITQIVLAKYKEVKRLKTFFHTTGETENTAVRSVIITSPILCLMLPIFC